LDGLLIDTEDIYTLSTNNVLTAHGRPHLTWSIKAKLMGVPGSSTGEVLLTWAQLPITVEQFAKELRHRRNCTSVKQRKEQLQSKAGESNGERAAEPLQQRPADLARVQKGRGKPAPDIYLLALETINLSLHESGTKITPAECLVFEDSIPGVEAGRRAGMRVVWVPHPGLAKEFKGREKEVLAGRIGLVEIGDEWQLGEIDDGWAEQLPSLVNFPFEKYGIEISRDVPGVNTLEGC
jgi:pseudouridine-5'-monophosphatase